MNKQKRQTLIYIAISVAVNLLLAAIAIFVFGVRFSTDDDRSMSYIAYGIYMEPSSRIVFSNVVIGWLMRVMFIIKPTINWQVVLYFAGLCASGFISLYEIMKTKKAKWYILWTLFVSIFFYCSFVSITFTVVAAYACCQGYLAFFLALKEKNIKCMILSGVVIVYASLIRFESVMAISMFAVVDWLIIVLLSFGTEKKFELREIVKKYVLPFVVLVVGIGAFYIGDKVAYASDEWRAYYEYNLLRGEVLDDCSIINMNDVAKQQELNISNATANSLNGWYFNDPEIFNKALFSAIDKKSTDLRKEYVRTPFKDTMQSLKNIFVEKVMFRSSLIVLGILLLISCLERRSGWQNKAVCLLASIIPLLVQIFAYCFMGRYSDVLQKELPVRIVEITIMGFCMCYILAEMCFEGKSIAQSTGKVQWIILGMALLVLLLMQTGEKYDLMGFSLKSESMIEENYNFLNDGHIYVMEYQALQSFMNEYRVWQNPSRGYLNNFIPLGGCEINYPYLVEKQNRLGVRNPYKSLYTNDNVYLVAVGEPKLEYKYLCDVYDENIDYNLVATHDNLFIYNFYVKY